MHDYESTILLDLASSSMYIWKSICNDSMVRRYIVVMVQDL